MNEILDEFSKESKELLSDCEEILEECEEGKKSDALLEEFSQKIDRIMGSAKSLYAMEPIESLNKIGMISELGKTLGYNSMALKDHPVYPIIIAFLLELVEILEEILDNMEDSEFLQERFDTIISRLILLQAKLQANPALQKEMKILMKRLRLS